MVLKPSLLSWMVTLDKVFSIIQKARGLPKSIGKKTKLKLLKDKGNWHTCCDWGLCQSVNPQSLYTYKQ